VVVSNSEFNLTFFPQEKVWGKKVDLDNNIQSLWTGTSCCSSVPGRIYHKRVEKCTKEEFIEEIKAQIFNCGALDEMIRDANNGKSLKVFSNVKIEIWHEWDHTAVKANVWSIEGAVESGRRAANLIDQRVKVIDQHRPGWLYLFARIDNILYKLKGPTVCRFNNYVFSLFDPLDLICKICIRYA
jgi:hypothetical protein